MSALATRKLPSGAIEAQLGGLTVLVRAKDGFINATRLCKDGGKEFKNWIRLDSADSFLKELEESAQICADSNIHVSLIEVGEGGRNSEGTWVHPDVAVQIANWISPAFAVKVSQIVRKYYSGDLSLAGEVVKNFDEANGTTSSVKIESVNNSVLGKRKLEAEIEALEASTREKNARLLRDCMEFIKPDESASEIERLRAESDISNLKTHFVRLVTGGVPLQLTDGHSGKGEEISFALMEHKLGVRLTKSQRMKAGVEMSRLMRERYGEDYKPVKRNEIVDGKVVPVNAYWAKDEDLMRSAIDSVL